MTTLAYRLLTAPSTRDQQVIIGPSTIGSPCDLCIVDGLTSTKGSGTTSKYKLGASIGTAVHLQLEKRIPELFPDAISEMKVRIGELEGYGVIAGTADLVIPDESRLIDWKTTTREKLVWIRQAFLYPPDESDNKKLKQAQFTCQKYVGQGHLYAMGLVRAGIKVEAITLSFICRDGKVEEDVWEVTFPYEPEYAQQVWDRLENIWNNLNAEYAPHPYCWEHSISKGWS